MNFLPLLMRTFGNGQILTRRIIEIKRVWDSSSYEVISSRSFLVKCLPGTNLIISQIKSILTRTDANLIEELMLV